MKKRVLIFSVLIAIIFIAFRFCSSKPEVVKEADVKPAPLTISQNSEQFNSSFSKLLQSYYSLKDAFINADIPKVNSAAAALRQDAANLDVNDIKGDSSIRETAKYFATTISTSAQSISAEVSPEAELTEFNTITDALWSLTRTVKYDQHKLYYHFCPKALRNSGGYWLSEKIENKNPYGLKENCSDVTDSLDYSKK